MKKTTKKSGETKDVTNELKVNELKAVVSIASNLKLKKHDQVMTLCLGMGKPDLALAVSEAIGIKVTATVENAIEILIGEYERNPTLSIGKKNQSGKFYPYLTLGKSKAKMILEHL